MARNRSVKITGDDTKLISVEDYYTSCIARVISTTSTQGVITVEYKDSVGQWRKLYGGEINITGNPQAKPRISGVVINDVRITTSGFDELSTTEVSVFFCDYDLSTIDNYSTNGGGNNARLRTDNQQTSFEQNAQFRFFDDCSGANEIDNSDTLIYRFSATNPVNIQSRVINGWEGGRKYLVYPSDGNETIAGGTWADVSDRIFEINGNLQDSGLDAHPTSGVTISKRVATSFTSTSLPRTGTAYRSDSSASRSVDSYSPDAERAGVAANAEFYLVFFDIAQNDPSQFLFSVSWEEIF